MAKFKNLLNISTDFVKIPKAFFEIFKDDYKEMVLLLKLIETMETFNSWDKLQSDKSFYISISKIEKMFFGGISRPTLIKLLNNLIDKGFISKKINYNSNQANFYKINCDKINKLCDTKTKRVYEKDEIDPPVEIEIKKPIKKETLPAVITKNDNSSDIIKGWNTIASTFNLSQIKALTPQRKKKFDSMLKQINLPLNDFFKILYDMIAISSFLSGKQGGWSCNFDFICRTDKALKIIEGGYTDHKADLNVVLSNPKTLTNKECERLRAEIKLANDIQKQHEEKELKRLQLEEEQREISQQYLGYSISDVDPNQYDENIECPF